MIKKLLLTLYLFVTTIGFSQEKTIKKLSAAPNPFTNRTNITYTSTSISEITLSVKNIIGKNVFTKKYTSKIGNNIIPFYKNDLATGVYIYSIQNSEKLISKRLVIK